MRKAIRSSAFRGIMIAYMAGIAAQFVLPPGIALAIIAGVMIVCTAIFYISFKRQVREEFRLLLQYLLTGQVLPACARCGYDLHGAIHSQCPECGADVKWKRDEIVDTDELHLENETTDGHR